MSVTPAGGTALDPDLAAPVLTMAVASGEAFPFKLACDSYLKVMLVADPSLY